MGFDRGFREKFPEAIAKKVKIKIFIEILEKFKLNSKSIKSIKYIKYIIYIK